MDPLKISSHHPETASVLPGVEPASGSVAATLNQRRLRAGLAGFMVVAALCFSKPLIALARLATQEDLHSHILLIPFITVYLLRIGRKEWPAPGRSSPGWAGIFVAISLGAVVLAGTLPIWGVPLDSTEVLCLQVFGFVAMVLAGGNLFLGHSWMRAAAFPMGFLFFMMPLPDRVVFWMENALKLASADAAARFLELSGTPFLRDGVFFQLPGIVIKVAQECSGLRSSWVLFITSLLAAHLFLKSPWRRTLFVVAVIPLGILRNGFRIMVISMLCVEIGPHMIHHFIHHRGGPVFFVLSLIPLFLLLWWLRRGEVRVKAPATGEGPLISRTTDLDH